jgi:hypothetical protein
MRLVSTTAALAVAGASLPALAITYHITDLGANADATAVNKANHVSGRFQHGHAARYADGQWTLYDKHADAGALDKKDDMIGTDSVGPQLVVPMYYDHTKSAGTPIPLPEGQMYGFWWAHTPGGISVDGKHVVGTYQRPTGYSGCYHWVPGQSVATNIGIPAGYQWCEALDVNKSGVIVGDVEDSAGDHAYVYSNGQFKVVGGVDTVLLGVNGHAHAVGYVGSLSTTATFWDGSHLSVLPTQGALTMTAARALNTSDTIVGQGTDGSDYTCMMYSHGVLTDLQKTLDNPGNWSLGYCTDINDAGVIVGIGYIGGQTHAFMLTPD